MSDDIRSYKDLIVWQKAHELVRKVLSICRSLPKNEETRIIKAQLINAVTSAPAN